MAALGNVALGMAFCALGIGVGDLPAGAAESKCPPVDLNEEGLGAVAQPGGEALGLGEPPCLRIAPGEVVLAQAFLRKA